MSISKYFWDINENALEETTKILKNPKHPQFPVKEDLERVKPETIGTSHRDETAGCFHDRRRQEKYHAVYRYAFLQCFRH